MEHLAKQSTTAQRLMTIPGTRAVLASLKDKGDRLSAWIRELIIRRGYKRAAVALAAKNARIIWALLVRGEAYQTRPMNQTG